MSEDLDNQSKQQRLVAEMSLPLMRERISKLEAQVSEIQKLADEQADDVSLWFPVGALATQLECLQLALRRLHGLIEGEPTPWLPR